MREVLLVGCGGFVGAVLRYGVARALGSGAGFPFATLAVNVAGSFALGWLVAANLRGAASEPQRLAFGVGGLGALTTFSTFSVETVALIERGSLGAALLSVAANVGLCLAAAAAGLALGR